VLCFRDKTNSILREHHANLQLGDEKNQIIKTAIKLICNDISTVDLDMKSYPTAKGMTDISSQLALVPESLQMFLRPIVKTDERVATWGQNFIKAYRPRSGVLPYQMGFAIQLDHRFGSKWLLNKLHRLGYTESYAEMLNYKYCFLNGRNRVGISDSYCSLDTIIEKTNDETDTEDEIDTEIENLIAASEKEVQVIDMEVEDVSHAVTQFVGDNVDLNSVSIYGNTPFHFMGMIRVTSPAPLSANERSVNRARLKSTDKAKILKAAEVNILPFTMRSQTGIETINFIPIEQLSSSVAQNQSLLSPGDVLWVTGWVVKAQLLEFQHANWNGWTKSIHADNAKHYTQVDFLPIVKGDPNDCKTIYTTLKECMRLSKDDVAIVTFDLPIWLKAVDIIKQQNLPIILR